MKQIEIIVEPDGTVRIEAKAFSGVECEQATAFLEEALGKVSSRERTPDYYRPARVNRTQRLGR